MVESKQSNIMATRRGFLYQDRVAVLEYLKLWLSANVKEYYVDWSLLDDRRKSFDIRSIDINGLESVYEVKSSEKFKDDKTEIKEALGNLYKYYKSKPEAQLYLIIKKESSGVLGKYRNNFIYIQKSVKNNKETRKFLKESLKILNLPGINDVKQLREFFNAIKIEARYEDEYSHGHDRYPDIDDSVISKINDIELAKSIFGCTANACAYEFPSEILMLRLYHICQLHAGEDVHPKFNEAIVEFIAHRRMLDKCYRKEKNVAETKAALINEVWQRVEKHLTGDTLETPMGEPSIKYKEGEPFYESK